MTEEQEFIESLIEDMEDVTACQDLAEVKEAWKEIKIRLRLPSEFTVRESLVGRDISLPGYVFTDMQFSTMTAREARKIVGWEPEPDLTWENIAECDENSWAPPVDFTEPVTIKDLEYENAFYAGEAQIYGQSSSFVSWFKEFCGIK